eukprot:CAMPEP_0203762522 /NCGR_PEP_ID=MMETSP0098-20131031/15387_1 /ASSEMBLY_ACC=CAM_ASM_000208 /TAXON_ID=96639 /ORGANISM=" , Strain NY0313808BC1" /LENGTH=3104 /DNA_ID=CAMNT_0050656965 /DNA_START=422 /DNA_END=9733 /DNA_ORIENTATION=-
MYGVCQVDSLSSVGSSYSLPCEQIVPILSTLIAALDVPLSIPVSGVSFRPVVKVSVFANYSGSTVSTVLVDGAVLEKENFQGLIDKIRFRLGELDQQRICNDNVEVEAEAGELPRKGLLDFFSGAIAALQYTDPADCPCMIAITDGVLPSPSPPTGNEDVSSLATLSMLDIPINYMHIATCEMISGTFSNLPDISNLLFSSGVTGGACFDVDFLRRVKAELDSRASGPRHKSKRNKRRSRIENIDDLNYQTYDEYQSRGLKCTTAMLIALLCRFSRLDNTKKKDTRVDMMRASSSASSLRMKGSSQAQGQGVESNQKHMPSVMSMFSTAVQNSTIESTRGSSGSLLSSTNEDDEEMYPFYSPRGFRAALEPRVLKIQTIQPLLNVDHAYPWHGKPPAVPVIVNELMEYRVHANPFEILTCRMKDGFYIKQIMYDPHVLCTRLVLHYAPHCTLNYILKTSRSKWRTIPSVVSIRLIASTDFHRCFSKIGKGTTPIRTNKGGHESVGVSLHQFINTIYEGDRVLIHLNKFSDSPDFVTALFGAFSFESLTRWNRWFHVTSFNILLGHSMLSEEFTSGFIGVWADYVTQLSAFGTKHFFKWIGDDDSQVLSETDPDSECFLQASDNSFVFGRVCACSDFFMTLHLAFPTCTTATSRAMTILGFGSALTEAFGDSINLIPKLRKPTLELSMATPSVSSETLMLNRGLLLKSSQSYLPHLFSHRVWMWEVPDNATGHRVVVSLVRARLREMFTLTSSNLRIRLGEGSKIETDESSSRSNSSARATFSLFIPTSNSNKKRACRWKDTCLVHYRVSCTTSKAVRTELWMESTETQFLPAGASKTISSVEMRSLIEAYLEEVDSILVSTSIAFLQIQACATNDMLLALSEGSETAKNILVPDVADSRKQVSVKKGVQSFLQFARQSTDQIETFQSQREIPSTPNDQFYQLFKASLSGLSDAQLVDNGIGLSCSYFAKVLDFHNILVIKLPMHQAQPVLESDSLESEEWKSNSIELTYFEISHNELRFPKALVAEPLRSILGYDLGSKGYANTGVNKKHEKNDPSRKKNQLVESFRNQVRDAYLYDMVYTVHLLFASNPDSETVEKILGTSDIESLLKRCPSTTALVDASLLRTILVATVSPPIGLTAQSTALQAERAKRKNDEIDLRFKSFLEEFFVPIPSTPFYYLAPKNTGLLFEKSDEDDDEEEEEEEEEAKDSWIQSESRGQRGSEMTEKGKTLVANFEKETQNLQQASSKTPPFFFRICCSSQKPASEATTGADPEQSVRIDDISSGRLCESILSIPPTDSSSNIFINLVFSTLPKHPEKSDTRDDEDVANTRNEDLMWLWTRTVRRKIRSRVKAMVSSAVLESLQRVYPVTERTILLVQQLLDRGSLPSEAITRITIPLHFIYQREGVNLFAEVIGKTPFLSLRQVGSSDVYFVVEPISQTPNAEAETSAQEPDVLEGLGNLFSPDYLDLTLSIAAPTNTLRKDWSTRDYSIPYWAIITVRGPSVTLEFHHPALSTQTGIRFLVDHLRNGLLKTAERVNQMMLLQQLHDTRAASDLLIEPDPPVPSRTSRTSTQSRNRRDIGTIDSTSEIIKKEQSELGSSLDLSKLPDGKFSCPCYHRVRYEINERLHVSSAMHELRVNALHSFIVTNRRNTFVYMDRERHVFYLKLRTTTEDPTAEHSGEQKYIMLEVHGIDPPTEEMKQMLHALLSNVIAGGTMQALARLLHRNPQFKIQPYDLEFIQRASPDAPQVRYELSIPRDVRDILLFLLFFRQNLYSFMHHLHFASTGTTSVGTTTPIGLQFAKLKPKEIEPKQVEHPACLGLVKVQDDLSEELDASIVSPASFGYSPETRKGNQHVEVQRDDFAFVFNSMKPKMTAQSRNNEIGDGLAVSFLSLFKRTEGGGVTKVQYLEALFPIKDAESDSLSTLRYYGCDRQKERCSLFSEGQQCQQDEYVVVVEMWETGQIDLEKLWERHVCAFNETLGEYHFESVVIDKPLLHEDNQTGVITVNCANVLAIEKNTGDQMRSSALDTLEIDICYDLPFSERVTLMKEFSNLVNSVQPDLCQFATAGDGIKFLEPFPLASETSDIDVGGQASPWISDKRSIYLNASTHMNFSSDSLSPEGVEVTKKLGNSIRFAQHEIIPAEDGTLTTIFSRQDGLISNDALKSHHVEVPVAVSKQAVNIETPSRPGSPLNVNQNSTTTVPGKLSLLSEPSLKRRACYSLIYLSEKRLVMHSYNWAPARVKLFHRALNFCLSWGMLRADLLKSALYQRMGLFANAALREESVTFFNEVLSRNTKLRNKDKTDTLSDWEIVLESRSAPRVFIRDLLTPEESRIGSVSQMKKPDVPKPPPNRRDTLAIARAAMQSRKRGSVGPNKYAFSAQQQQQQPGTGMIHSSSSNTLDDTGSITTMGSGSGHMRHYSSGTLPVAPATFKCGREFQFQLRGQVQSMLLESFVFKRYAGDPVRMFCMHLVKNAEIRRVSEQRALLLRTVITRWRREWLGASSVRVPTFPYTAVDEGFGGENDDFDICVCTKNELNELLRFSRVLHCVRAPTFFAVHVHKHQYADTETGKEFTEKAAYDLLRMYVQYLVQQLGMCEVVPGANSSSSNLLVERETAFVQKVLNGAIVIMQISAVGNLLKCSMRLIEPGRNDDTTSISASADTNDLFDRSERLRQAPTYQREVGRIRSLLNLAIVAYDYHIYLFQRVLRNFEREPCGIACQVFHFAKFYPAPPVGAQNSLHRQTFQFLIGIPLPKDNVMDIFRYVVTKASKYGIIGLKPKEKDGKSYLFLKCSDGTFSGKLKTRNSSRTYSVVVGVLDPQTTQSKPGLEAPNKSISLDVCLMCCDDKSLEKALRVNAEDEDDLQKFASSKLLDEDQGEGEDESDSADDSDFFDSFATFLKKSASEEGKQPSKTGDIISNPKSKPFVPPVKRKEPKTLSMDKVLDNVDMFLHKVFSHAVLRYQRNLFWNRLKSANQLEFGLGEINVNDLVRLSFTCPLVDLDPSFSEILSNPALCKPGLVSYLRGVYGDLALGGISENTGSLDIVILPCAGLLLEYVIHIAPQNNGATPLFTLCFPKPLVTTAALADGRIFLATFVHTICAWTWENLVV